MKTLIKLIMVMFLSFNALAIFLSIEGLAQDSWICKEESSVRRGDAIHQCGVSTAYTEDVARSQAFDNARVEFEKICNASDDCDIHKIMVEPTRTTCEENNNIWKCYRMIVFHINGKKEEQQIAQTSQEENDLKKTEAMEEYWERWRARNLR